MYPKIKGGKYAGYKGINPKDLELNSVRMQRSAQRRLKKKKQNFVEIPKWV
jgi:hypothetical protein